jgi:hypothetical protein
MGRVGSGVGRLVASPPHARRTNAARVDTIRAIGALYLGIT